MSVREVVIHCAARVGYGARGVVFVTIGGFAFLAALGGHDRPIGTMGAFEALFARPLGQALLLLVAVGLVCFAVWRVIQAVFDPDKLGRDRKGIIRRLAMLGGALANLALAVLALTVFLGVRGANQEDAVAKDWTGWLLGQPFGRTLVGLIGLSIIVTGGSFVVKAVQAEFRNEIAATASVRGWVVILGQFGYITRGIAFALIGIFLVVAAWDSSAREATGLAGALDRLRQQIYGPYMLGLVAMGLGAYGVFEFIQAIARRIDASKATLHD